MQTVSIRVTCRAGRHGGRTQHEPSEETPVRPPEVGSHISNEWMQQQGSDVRSLRRIPCQTHLSGGIRSGETNMTTEDTLHADSARVKVA
jgi:hypothetical protein